MIDYQFVKNTNKRKAGDEVVQFFLQLGDGGERVEVRQQENGQLAIGKNQLELLLIRAPADHALRRKYLGAGAAQWKPTPQPALLGGGGPHPTPTGPWTCASSSAACSSCPDEGEKDLELHLIAIRTGVRPFSSAPSHVPWP